MKFLHVIFMGLSISTASLYGMGTKDAFAESAPFVGIKVSVAPDSKKPLSVEFRKSTYVQEYFWLKPGRTHWIGNLPLFEENGGIAFTIPGNFYYKPIAVEFVDRSQLLDAWKKLNSDKTSLYVVASVDDKDKITITYTLDNPNPDKKMLGTYYDPQEKRVMTYQDDSTN